MPELYIITGSNGAGKSSVGIDYLPTHIQQQYNIFDGDKLFMQKQKELWLSGMRAHKEAKRIAFEYVEHTFYQLVETALANNDHFVYEGHFTNEATWNIPQKFKQQGYIINMIFFGLTNPDLSELRVIDRVKEGGHSVPRLTIEDNFYGNLEKLNQHYALIDNLTIVDTSEITHSVLINLINKQLSFAVKRDQLPEWFIKYLPHITDIMSNV